ncbi:MAG: hypothetical protein R3D30_09030 [Hyphomicrobiales bacterium]
MTPRDDAKDGLMDHRGWLGVCLSFLLSVLLVPGSTAAADAAACDAYADQAAQQAALAVRFACKFHGPRWSNDADTHREWCRASTKAAVQAEADSRTTDIRLCMCDWYANNALSQAKANDARGCGFAGPRWSLDRSAHYRWCVLDKAPLKTLESEIKTRQELLAKCASTDR